jgi:hypothetical protein
MATLEFTAAYTPAGAIKAAATIPQNSHAPVDSCGRRMGSPPSSWRLRRSIERRQGNGAMI